MNVTERAHSRPDRRHALAVRAAGGAFGRREAGPAADQHRGRRAAAPGSALRRAGARRAHRGFRPLSGQYRHRGLPPRRRGLARPALPARPPDRSVERNSGAGRHARGPVPGGDRRQALGKPAPGQARDADPESVLCGLCGGRGRGRLRAGLSRRHRRERLPARSRRARRPSCSRAPSRSISPRRRTRRARSPTRPISSA